MEERRRTTRMKDDVEITITVVSEENGLPKEKIIRNYTKDISMSGAGIQTHILLPVDTLIELEFTSNGIRQQINALGKVKWIKVLIEDEYYEAGVEFADTPGNAIKKLEDYISWKIKYNKTKISKKYISPTDSGDINIIETKEQPPIVSGDTNIVETKEQLPIVLDDINIVETKERPSIDSGDINIVKTKEQPPTDSGDINTVNTKELFPIKNKQRKKIAILSLSAIILIVVLLTTFGFIPELDKVLVPNIITKAKPAPEVKATPVPVPEAKATPTPEVTPLPEATPAPAPEATQNIIIIGNSDSKKYHLPGMKYYNSVKAYHRVEFNSEADAIKAGYNKAPQ